MNITKHNGESSCKGREDGDASTGFERPLKKARFAWQVKGKYHLKNSTDESNKTLTKSAIESSANETLSMTKTPMDSIGSEVGNCTMEQDYSQLDSVLNPDAVLIPTSLTKDQMQYPRYLSSSERTAMNNSRTQGSSSCTNVKTVSLTDIAEDQCIAQWQARQIVKGCLDNTLNRVLESWTTDPLPGDEANSRFLAMDFAEFINHLPGDNSVENEGILMAISAHGLQNASSSSSNDTDAENCSISSTSACNLPLPLPSISPMISDEEPQDPEDINYKEKLPNKIQDWQCDTENSSEVTPFAYFSEPSESPYELYDDSHQNSDTGSLDIESHFDLMNAAVLYAIKSKGLTASGTEYG